MSNFLTRRNNTVPVNRNSDQWRNDPWSLFDRLFDNSALGLRAPAEWTQDFAPAIDVEDLENEYRVHADLPGLNKEDIHVDYKDGVLSLSGERSGSREDKRDSAVYVERSFGKFTRSFRLPQEVNADKIEAKYNDGVLSVMLPKKAESLSRKIKIG